MTDVIIAIVIRADAFAATVPNGTPAPAPPPGSVTHGEQYDYGRRGR